MTELELAKKEIIRERNRNYNRKVAADENKRLARNAYQREWRKNHPDAVKAANKRYLEKKAWQRLERQQTEQDQTDGGTR